MNKMADHQRKAGPRLHVMYKVIWPVNWMDWKTRAGSHSMPKGPRGCGISGVDSPVLCTEQRLQRSIRLGASKEASLVLGIHMTWKRILTHFGLGTLSVLSQVEVRQRGRKGGTAGWWPFLH